MNAHRKRRLLFLCNGLVKLPRQDKAVSFGVPFDKGEVFPENKLRLSAESGEDIPIDTWTLAYWPDGSVKWGGIAGVIPAGTEKLTLEKAVKKSKAKSNCRIQIKRSPFLLQKHHRVFIFLPESFQHIYLVKANF